MLDLSVARLETCAIHFAGNKALDEEQLLTSHPVPVDNPRVQSALHKYLLSAFKGEEIFRFDRKPANEVMACVNNILARPGNLIDESVKLAELLSEKLHETNLRGGELFVCHFSACQSEGFECNAVGIFRVESKDSFLKLHVESGQYFANVEEGININKLERGCLIANLQQDEGYTIYLVEGGKAAESQLWRNAFLRLKPAEDNYHFTSNILKVTKEFVTREMQEEFPVSKADTIELLNRSISYFKENDTFDKDQFAESVFVDERVIDSFKKYDEDYSKYNDLPSSNNFEISDHAVKRQAKIFKSVLKLDKNFHVYIHGNREKIERGVEEDGRKYYKLYFEEEA